jgi:hypothetical protein
MSECIGSNVNFTPRHESLVPRKITAENLRESGGDDASDAAASSAETKFQQDQQDQGHAIQVAINPPRSSSSVYSDSVDADAGIKDSFPSDQASCGSESPSQEPLNSDNTGDDRDKNDSSEPETPPSTKLSPNDGQPCTCAALDQTASIRRELSTNRRAWKDLVEALLAGLEQHFEIVVDFLQALTASIMKHANVPRKREDWEKGHGIGSDAASSTVENGKLATSLSEIEGNEEEVPIIPRSIMRGDREKRPTSSNNSQKWFCVSTPLPTEDNQTRLTSMQCECRNGPLGTPFENPRHSNKENDLCWRCRHKRCDDCGVKGNKSFEDFRRPTIFRR